MRTLLSVLFSSSLLALAGCGQSVSAAPIAMAPPADLSAPPAIALLRLSDARTLGQLFAMNSYFSARLPSDRIPACAVRTMDGATSVFTIRDCVTRDGERDDGVIRTRGDAVAGPDSRVEYRSFRNTRTTACSDGTGRTLANTTTWNGHTSTIARANVRDFEIDLVLEFTSIDAAACTAAPQTIAIQYRGSLEYTGPDGVRADNNQPMRASGSGVVSDSLLGRADTRTDGLVFDPMICSTEPASGALTLRSGSRTGVLAYDGASRCGRDATRTAPYTLDGTLVGEIQVNACSVRGATGRSRWGGLGLAVASLGALFAHRRARSRR